MYWEPLYQISTKPFKWEEEIIHSRTFRRLKHIRHYGAVALITPLNHSRYEHSLGVWTITAKFFPENIYLRLAALLHDIGHLPFSHSLEKTLELSHHKITESKILNGEIFSILKKHNLEPQKVLAILYSESPLANTTDKLGIDHLDSFLRDTYMAGKFTKLPSEIVKDVWFNDIYIESDEKTAFSIIESIICGHEILLNPISLAVDKLLAMATYMYAEHRGDKEFVKDLVDFQLLSILQKSGLSDVEEILEVILYQPHRIEVSNVSKEGDFEVGVRKLYAKTPLVNNIPFIHMNQRAKEKMEGLNKLKRTYYLCIKKSIIL